ncbi:MAG: chemotaxis response regulator protein-glutamate methylesterase [Spirochaetaceae bacterium]|nr:MAG: chemotaxis response regulator protein-glutamate methylesterase [Spirochaetaceae bacterium]
MNNDTVSVLVVDDSALMRNLISKIIENAPGLEVAGTAMNGVFALQKIERLQPDVIVLDLEMPQMDGIGFLEQRRTRAIDIPVVVLSSIAHKGAHITMEAISLGASDFLLKPSGSVSDDIHSVATQLTEMLRGYGREYRRRKGRSTADAPHAAQPATAARAAARTAAAPADAAPVIVEPVGAEAAPAQTEIIAIGISTGGPNALRKVFAALDDDLPVPLVVVQHMPAGFTAEFARSLDRICPLEVKEAEEGDLLKPGRILIAPGNRHMRVERKSLAGVVHLSDDEPCNGHRPSVDILFASLAQQYANRGLAVIMTGMGRDGAVELGLVRRRGGITIGQDASSCVVYGMPRVAFELGHVTQQVALHQMAETICRLAKEQRD